MLLLTNAPSEHFALFPNGKGERRMMLLKAENEG